MDYISGDSVVKQSHPQPSGRQLVNPGARNGVSAKRVACTSRSRLVDHLDQITKFLHHSGTPGACRVGSPTAQRRKPLRCPAMTVAGLTISRAISSLPKQHATTQDSISRPQRLLLRDRPMQYAEVMPQGEVLQQQFSGEWRSNRLLGCSARLLTGTQAGLVAGDALRRSAQGPSGLNGNG